MKNLNKDRPAECGSAGIKFLLITVVIVLLANAGYNYIPVAYEGASFRQEMDTAVVKGLAASGQMKPMDVVTAHIKNAAKTNNVPSDVVIEIKPNGKMIQANAWYSKQVNVLPFGIYNYSYQFSHTAVPNGYLASDQ